LKIVIEHTATPELLLALLTFDLGCSFLTVCEEEEPTLRVVPSRSIAWPLRNAYALKRQGHRLNYTVE